MSAVSMTEENPETVNIEDMVERSMWEPMHEYQSRLVFVEDNVARHGLEKAVRLSLVWANMHFLGCRYPDKTEEMVSFYPLPTPNEISSRKQRRPPKLARANKDQSNQPDPNTPLPSRQEVSDMISSIRSETELTLYPKIVQSIGNTLCLCVQCLGTTDSELAKAQKMLEKHTAKSTQPVEMTFKESEDGHSCVLVYQGETAMMKTANTKKDAKTALCTSHQLPACEHTMSQQPPSQEDYQQQGSYRQHGEYRPPAGDYQGQGSYRQQSGGYRQNEQYHKPRGYSGPPSQPYRNYQAGGYNTGQSGYGQHYDQRQGDYGRPAGSYDPRGQPHGGHQGGYIPPDHYSDRGNYLMPPRPRGHY